MPGRIAALSGAGVVVQLGHKLQGIAALTDLHDSWTANALSSLAIGDYVRARVLGQPGTRTGQPLQDSKARVRLSLRPRDGGRVVRSCELGDGAPEERPPAPPCDAAAAAGVHPLGDDGLLQLQGAGGPLKPGAQVGWGGAIGLMDTLSLPTMYSRDAVC